MPMISRLDPFIDIRPPLELLGFRHLGGISNLKFPSRQKRTPTALPGRGHRHFNFLSPGRKLVRNLLQCQPSGAWPENSNRKHDHQHAGRDECKNSPCAEVLEKESDHEACENCREAAPGIYEPNRASPNPAREKLGLIGMERVGQEIIGQRYEHSKNDQRYGSRLPRKEEPERRRADRRADDLPLALEPVGNQRAEQWADRIDQCNYCW